MSGWLRALGQALGIVLVCLGLLATPHLAQAAVIPHGDRFPVDPDGEAQAWPDVAVSASGASLIVWQGPGAPGTGIDIFAQLHLPDGSVRQFIAHTGRAGSQLRPSAAMSASGSFVIAWESLRADDEVDVFVRFFDSSGAALGEEQEINPVPVASDRAPDVAMAPDGSAIVVWQSFVRSGQGLGSMAWRLFASTYAPGGVPKSNLRLGDGIEGNQTAPRAAMASADRYTVVWEQLPPQIPTAPPELNAMKVYLTHVAPGGGYEGRVSSGATGSEREPAVALDAEGNLVVAWSGESGTEGEVLARLYPDGVPTTMTFQVNTAAAGPQGKPSVALGQRGDVLIAWHSGAAGGQPVDVFARSFSITGQPDGGPFPLAASDDRRAQAPQVALRPNGSGLAVWHSLPPAGLGLQSYARRLGPPFARDPEPTPIPRTPVPGPDPGQPVPLYQVMLPLVRGG